MISFFPFLSEHLPNDTVTALDDITNKVLHFLLFYSKLFVSDWYQKREDSKNTSSLLKSRCTGKAVQEHIVLGSLSFTATGLINLEIGKGPTN